MRVDDLQLTGRDGRCELSGRVTMDRLDTEDLRLWYRFPEEWAQPALDASPFVPSLMATAMWWNEPLRIEGPVSEQLLGSLDLAQRVYRSLFPDTLHLVDVSSAEAVALPAGRDATLCMFSRGVDSWYSLLRNLDPPSGPPVTHLLFIPDVDFQYSQLTRDQTMEDTLAAAERVGRPLVVLETNLRRFTERFQEWGITHGSVLAGMSLALGASTVLLPSPLAYGAALPYGSHPVLDPLWSTERTEIVHDGAESNRIGKIRYLAEHPVALDWLKVCYESDTRVNCGRCIKCVLTLVGLAAVDAPGGTDRFETPLSASRLARMPVKNAGHRALLLELVPLLHGSRARRRLGRALQVALARDDLRSARHRVAEAVRPRRSAGPSAL